MRLGAAHDGAEPALHHVGRARVVVHAAGLHHLPRQQIPLVRRVLRVWEGACDATGAELVYGVCMHCKGAAASSCFPLWS